MSCSCFHRSHQKVYPAQVWIITSLPGLSVLFVISTFPFCSRLHLLHCSSTLCRDILCCCLWSFPYRCKILPFFFDSGKMYPWAITPEKNGDWKTTYNDNCTWSATAKISPNLQGLFTEIFVLSVVVRGFCTLCCCTGVVLDVSPGQSP